MLEGAQKRNLPLRLGLQRVHHRAIGVNGRNESSVGKESRRCTDCARIWAGQRHLTSNHYHQHGSLCSSWRLAHRRAAFTTVAPHS